MSISFTINQNGKPKMKANIKSSIRFIDVSFRIADRVQDNQYRDYGSASICYKPSEHKHQKVASIRDQGLLHMMDFQVHCDVRRIRIHNWHKVGSLVA
jgi:hypothetical protein